MQPGAMRADTFLLVAMTERDELQPSKNKHKVLFSARDLCRHKMVNN